MVGSVVSHTYVFIFNIITTKNFFLAKDLIDLKFDLFEGGGV